MSTSTSSSTMSLKQAYLLATEAQLRLSRESARPNRSLRFIAGHLAHYESLRLRIELLEDERARKPRPAIDHKFQPSSRTPSRLSHSSSSYNSDSDSDSDPDDEFNEVLYEDDFEDCASLSLMRCPSRSPSPPPAPDLEFDSSEEEDDDDTDSSDDECPASPPPNADVDVRSGKKIPASVFAQAFRYAASAPRLSCRGDVWRADERAGAHVAA